MKTSFAFPALVLGALLTSTALDARAAEDEVRYYGTVVDEAGKPVTGATLELFNFAQPFSPTGEAMKPAKTTSSSAKGEFEFPGPAAQVLLFAYKPGLAPAWVYNWRPSGDVEEQLVLTAPTTISGTVLDEKDQPVANAEVWLSKGYSEVTSGGGRTSQYVPMMPHRNLFSAKTGADGKFRIEGCPTNAAFDLEVKASEKCLRLTQRQFTSAETMLWRPGLKDLKLVVQAAGVVEGKLRSHASGDPIAGATISLQAQGRSEASAGLHPELTKADGTFRFAEVPPGSYSVHALFGTNNPHHLVAEYAKVNVEAGRTTRDIELAGVKAAFLEVQVAGKSDRKPLAGVNVNASGRSFGAGGVTDTKGTVELALVPGEYTVTTYAQNRREQQSSVSVETNAPKKIQMEIEAPRMITGVVLDPAGKPVSGLALRIMPEWRLNLGTLKTDTQGRFSFPWNSMSTGNPNETCCIVARDVARNLATAEDLTDETRDLELKLQPGLSVSGRVEDLQGKPLTKATVQLFFWAGNSGFSFENKPTKVDDDGRFLIKGLPVGRRYSSSATARGYGSQSQEIRSEDGDTNVVNLAPFALNVADQKLAGQVVDADDKPVASAWVNIHGPGQPNASIRTDTDGRFKLDEVCEGSVQVSASSERSYGNVQAQAGDTNVLVKLGVNSYSVRETPRRPSLVGKPLPDLAALGLGGDCPPAGKPVLLCLIDIDQRPCRRFARLLNEQVGALHQKGITVIALQAAISTPESFKEWKDANPVEFPLGQLTEKSQKTKWITDVESFPWLILTDKTHSVVAEGFAFEELETKLKIVEGQ